MQSKRTGTVFRIIVFALTALAIAFAFFQSMMSAAESSAESGGVLDFVIGAFHNIGVSPKITDHSIRKLAHFAEYFVIGGLLMSCAYSFDRFKPYRYSFQVLFTGLFTAVCDEFIQLFSYGRSGEVRDVLIDFSGVVAGSLVMLLFYSIYIKIKGKKYGTNEGS